MRFSVEIGSPDGRRAKRSPDLVRPRAGGERVAIEFERSRKSVGRLARIVDGYREAADAFAGIRFYVCDGVTAGGLARAI